MHEGMVQCSHFSYAYVLALSSAVYPDKPELFCYNCIIPCFHYFLTLHVYYNSLFIRCIF